MTKPEMNSEPYECSQAGYERCPLHGKVAALESEVEQAEIDADRSMPIPDTPIADRMRSVLLGQQAAIDHCDEETLDEQGLCECMHRLHDTLLAEKAEAFLAGAVAMQEKVKAEISAAVMQPSNPYRRVGMDRAWHTVDAIDPAKLRGGK